MKIFAKGNLVIRTVQEVGAPIYARIGVNEREHFPYGVSEKLSHAEAIELGARLMGFGMSRNPDAHIEAMMTEFIALIAKYTGQTVNPRPYGPNASEGH